MAFRNPGGITFGDPGTPPARNVSPTGKDLEIVSDLGFDFQSDNGGFGAVADSIGFGVNGVAGGGSLSLLQAGASALGDAILSGTDLAVVEAPDSDTNEVALRIGLGIALLRLLYNNGDPNIALHFNSATASFRFNNPAGAAKRSLDILETGGLDVGAPPASFGRLFCRTVAGKVTLQIRFPSGASQLIASEP